MSHQCRTEPQASKKKKKKEEEEEEEEEEGETYIYIYICKISSHTQPSMCIRAEINRPSHIPATV